MLRHSSMPGMSSWITLRSLHLTVILPRGPTNLKHERQMLQEEAHTDEKRKLEVGTIDSLQNEGFSTQDFRILILFSCCNIHHDNALTN